MILKNKLDIIIHIISYICLNIHYIAPKLLDDHRTKMRQEEGMPLIGGLKAIQADLIME